MMNNFTYYSDNVWEMYYLLFGMMEQEQLDSMLNNIDITSKVLLRFLKERGCRSVNSNELLRELTSVVQRMFIFENEWEYWINVLYECCTIINLNGSTYDGQYFYSYFIKLIKFQEERMNEGMEIFLRNNRIEEKVWKVIEKYFKIIYFINYDSGNYNIHITDNDSYYKICKMIQSFWEGEKCLYLQIFSKKTISRTLSQNEEYGNISILYNIIKTNKVCDEYPYNKILLNCFEQYIGTVGYSLFIEINEISYFGIYLAYLQMKKIVMDKNELLKVIKGELKSKVLDYNINGIVVLRQIIFDKKSCHALRIKPGMEDIYKGYVKLVEKYQNKGIKEDIDIVNIMKKSRVKRQHSHRKTKVIKTVPSEETIMIYKCLDSILNKRYEKEVLQQIITFFCSKRSEDIYEMIKTTINEHGWSGEQYEIMKEFIENYKTIFPYEVYESLIKVLHDTKKSKILLIKINSCNEYKIEILMSMMSNQWFWTEIEKFSYYQTNFTSQLAQTIQKVCLMTDNISIIEKGICITTAFYKENESILEYIKKHKKIQGTNIVKTVEEIEEDYRKKEIKEIGIGFPRKYPLMCIDRKEKYFIIKCQGTILCDQNLMTKILSKPISKKVMGYLLLFPRLKINYHCFYNKLYNNKYNNTFLLLNCLACGDTNYPRNCGFMDEINSIKIFVIEEIDSKKKILTISSTQQKDILKSDTDYKNPCTRKIKEDIYDSTTYDYSSSNGLNYDSINEEIKSIIPNIIERDDSIERLLMLIKNKLISQENKDCLMNEMDNIIHYCFDLKKISETYEQKSKRKQLELLIIEMIKESNDYKNLIGTKIKDILKPMNINYDNKVLIEVLSSGEEYVGIKNLTNTCYVNSSLQALFHCKLFRDDVIKEKLDIGSISTIFKEMARKTQVNISDSIQMLTDKQINVEQQDDATLMLNSIINRIKTGNEQLINNHFKIEKEFKKVCPFCHIEQVVKENCYYLHVQPNNSIIESINSSLTESIEGYYCEKCHQTERIERKSKIIETSNYLIVEINRTEYDVVGRRNNHDIKFDEEIEVIHGEKMRLICIINHYGSLDAGHYNCWCRVSKNRWYNFNDLSVEEINVTEKLSSNKGVIAIYCKESKEVYDSDFDETINVNRIIKQYILNNEEVISIIESYKTESWANEINKFRIDMTKENKTNEIY
ncbi:ubiquitin carboxyl-terminal hydrolase domain containing protein [Entamoeba histolytica HM-1:IMSS-B]|uniref:Ubiquitin carboxyl-terminal hydrolase domain containing protein n=4 Tax=Entamoeba histolytica TaxID=5759 RepID=B1N3J1_ENTH1|nr:ubiquitin carboxyl-terminal hydrolase domain containing protein [Entamoeba histolytica HM-1:IMSS]EDS89467.1 ubiquitin carboxyl-terminal hydrolase domain containing protein [Entamoeba histolytica HM-1:IMSS]EMH76971.1 ubiquitin carboxyl-terminal hydrolase domain containing protein [Entamoeba histolytica HM-1:IMSS-B]ENY64222.1 ubiquitin carboxyl-terminal hydrolase domain containing protein [Entamoeba histolytica HM-1:IMSS-A]GAT95719.1 ubiquitin carboxyl-terminal hydrolase domain containing prot|eukprot:XP_001913757.1 ubiquitin carboxyl-terminal hydrolase domain containing protein [Entamoeba histolytica HM-1:IMSS]